LSLKSNKKRNSDSSNSGSHNMLESHIRVVKFSRGWIPFAERVGERCARDSRIVGKVACGEKRERGTEVNTREYIVCGERTGSVAILRIAPRRFCFRFRCPRSFSAPALPPVRPPPLCPFVSSGSLSRILLSSGAHSYVKFGTARQRGVMYDLTGRDAFLSRFLSHLHKAGESRKIVVYKLVHSSSPHSADSNVRHCSLIVEDG